MSYSIDTQKDALIVVDVQNDFCPGGALEVPEGDAVVPLINRLKDRFVKRVYSRDWHPADHLSFAQDPDFVDKSWPPHCVQETEGARFHPALEVPADAFFVLKGTEADAEAYSVFDGTGLAGYLREWGVERVFVVGLAEDVCVRFTTLDALREGFATVLVEDGTRGIDPEEIEKTLEEIREQGGQVVTSGEIEG
jgi:nicotinamidase/pyrazinamidase